MAINEPRRASVCVYCGSKPGVDPAHGETARRLGRGVAEMGARLVYGAGDNGLMGEVSRAAVAAGGDVLGVIPSGLFEREGVDRSAPNVVVTPDLPTRKARMLAEADVCAVLPGGVGTLDEMVEAASWRTLGLHETLIVLIDVGGFWRPFATLCRQMAAQEYLYQPLLAEAGAPGADDAPILLVEGVEAALAEIARLANGRPRDGG